MKKRKATQAMKHEYAIKPDTTVILPHYDANGVLNALICNAEGFYQVGLTPYDLMDLNLRYRGSSMRGAMDGAEILVHGKMNPIVLDKEMNMVFFPSTSPRKSDCVWFSLNCVLSSIAIDKTHTQVNLSNGSAVTVNISKRTFDLKLNRAYELLYKIRQRRIEFEDPAMRFHSTYHLCVKENGVNYEAGHIS
ncbi:competence protein ComK [Planococcus liqunii]|uniref:competence protein ComK n=1 Tax=Planococcus liqunii TaxID=3058394 RepID=UPI0026318A09|nr:competence protein ComK [Planococcus sp. N056]WKA50188.1 competence protein ComK [Planococcus sp. N056]